MTVIVNSRLLSPSFLVQDIGTAFTTDILFGHSGICTQCKLPLHILSGLVSKEVIRPQVPLRPPCYDFALVADPRFDSANAAQPRQEPTSMKRRAVCARSRDVFTARW